ncbi:hypothetical protein [Mesorhizobium temperatum]|uniref:Uncharacterized protein n=1 Tax=Mesorhizobium temperatum TaxID=241416 RepID=A0A271LL92_9HYPH|nr:hypothetical protein [Mesorhizobium temperatum]PAQ08135.1 hypothetical protein CIT26_19435 [Mesorhizobium temperatum]
MDVLWFLTQRTKFIRRYYETASAPFREIIRKIEAEEAPYEPPYSEDPEPPFLTEWGDANTSLDVLGATCVSMLSESLKLYFSTWEGLLHVDCGKHSRSSFKKGFVSGYRDCFGTVLKADWSDCPADFDVLEQIVLARNAAGHPVQIAFLHLSHSEGLEKKFPAPVFVSDYERRLIETNQHVWRNLKLVVTEEALSEAIRQVEILAEWMEARLFKVLYPRSGSEG